MRPAIPTGASGSPTVTHMLPRGAFTLSLDFELIWGSRDLVQDPAGLDAMSRVTRARVFEPLLRMFDRYGVVGTWATVGALFLDEARIEGGRLHPDLPNPAHAWRPDWLAGVPSGTEAEHPAWYGRSLVRRLVEAGQEVGSHAFTHTIFGDPGCSEAVADAELTRAVAVAGELGITLRSLVFPRNVAGHLHLLKRHGFTCWRGEEPVWYRRAGLPVPLVRLAHLADVLAGARPVTVLPTRDEHGLWNIPSSAVFAPVDGGRRFIPMRQRVRRARRGIDAAEARREICHLYIHPINFATDPDRMLHGLDRVLAHAARRRDAGALDILSMGAIAARAEAGG